MTKAQNLEGQRVLILTGEYGGGEGVCLGESDQAGLWAVSSDDGDEIVHLRFENDFSLLIDLSADPARN